MTYKERFLEKNRHTFYPSYPGTREDQSVYFNTIAGAEAIKCLANLKRSLEMGKENLDSARGKRDYKCDEMVKMVRTIRHYTVIIEEVEKIFKEDFPDIFK